MTQRQNMLKLKKEKVKRMKGRVGLAYTNKNKGVEAEDD